MPEILSIGELLDLGNSASTAGLIPYSALEYNGSGNISGISGSAIAGGVDTTVVSAIASSYVESGISDKVDQSAFDNCCSAMSSVVSSKLDASASSMFQPSGNYYSASNPSGFLTSADLSSKLDASASSQFAPSGDYVFESSYSSFSGDVIINISSMSSIVSGLTGDYLEKSASGMFAPSGNYADSSSLSSYIPFSSVSGSNSTITAINGSAIGGAGPEFTGVVTDGTLTGNGLPNSALGVASAVVSSIVSSYVESSVSGKADKSALDNCCSAMSSVVSAKADSSALTRYVSYSALKHGPTTATISAINNSAVYDNSAHARINTLSTSRIPFSALEYSAGSQTITAISGSAIAGQNFNPTQLQLIADSATMTASSVANGVKIGVKVPIMVVSNSSQATANGVVYVVTG